MNSAVVTPMKIVLAKAGLDAHERGVHVVALGLRDAGAEVIYLGLRRPAREVVAIAVQEDADFIGLSSLAGGHLAYTRDVTEEIERQGCRAQVIIGGVIPEGDIPRIRELGVAEVFLPGTLVRTITERLTELVQAEDHE